MGTVWSITRDGYHPDANSIMAKNKLTFLRLPASAKFSQQPYFRAIRNVQGRIAPFGQAHFNQLPQGDGNALLRGASLGRDFLVFRHACYQPRSIPLRIRL